MENPSDREPVRSAPWADNDPYLDDSALSAQVGLRLRLAEAAVWGDLIATFKPFGMRPQHYAALTLIAAHPGLKQQEIGDRLGISPSNMVALIEELVGAGAVERRVMAENRRSNLLSISPGGAALLEKMTAAQRAHEKRLDTVLSESERRQLVDLLSKAAQL